MNTCIYSLNDDKLTLRNNVFSYVINGVDEVLSIQTGNSDGLSALYTEISARKGETVTKYRLWDGLPVIYTPEHKGGELLTLDGLHWIVKNVKLHAFTDDNDTLVTEQEQHLYHRKLFQLHVF